MYSLKRHQNNSSSCVFSGASQVVFGGKESACQCRRCGFDLWVRKIPWRRAWQPTPVFLPGESHGQRSLAGYSPRGHRESDTAEQLSAHKELCKPLSFIRSANIIAQLQSTRHGHSLWEHSSEESEGSVTVEVNILETFSFAETPLDDMLIAMLTLLLVHFTLCSVTHHVRNLLGPWAVPRPQPAPEFQAFMRGPGSPSSTPYVDFYLFIQLFHFPDSC